MEEEKTKVQLILSFVKIAEEKQQTFQTGDEETKIPPQKNSTLSQMISAVINEDPNPLEFSLLPQNAAKSNYQVPRTLTDMSNVTEKKNYRK